MGGGRRIDSRRGFRDTGLGRVLEKEVLRMSVGYILELIFTGIEEFAVKVEFVGAELLEVTAARPCLSKLYREETQRRGK